MKNEGSIETPELQGTYENVIIDHDRLVWALKLSLVMVSGSNVVKIEPSFF